MTRLGLETRGTSPLVYVTTGQDVPPPQRHPIVSPEDAADALRIVLPGTDREHGLMLMLDSRYHLIDGVVFSVGSVDHTFMAPREILRDALLGGAAALVLGHNHPSGDPTPSPDDLAVTRRLVAACDLMGIPMLDHIVLGDGASFASIARSGAVDF